ncbi:MAG: hypothetical protein QNJ04_08150, partial [Desulfobacterales bacterium]|nr:hypothetical protein [Desulfobacterales bacterium]
LANLQPGPAIGGRQKKACCATILCQHGNGLIARHGVLNRKGLLGASRLLRQPPPGNAKLGRRQPKTRQRPGQCPGNVPWFAVTADARNAACG